MEIGRVKGLGRGGRGLGGSDDWELYRLCVATVYENMMFVCIKLGTDL